MFEHKFVVTDWYDNPYKMTAKELYDRIMEDSKSDYNWFTSAEELVRVTRSVFFPKEYADGIRLAILNCYANYESRKSKRVDIRCLRRAEKSAIHECYNDVSTNERSTAIRHKYLKGLISGVCECHFGFLEFNHSGPMYNRMCKKWKEKKFEENKDRTYIVIEELEKALHDDFDQFMRQAEAYGAFDDDDQKRAEEWAKIAGRIFNALK